MEGVIALGNITISHKEMKSNIDESLKRKLEKYKNDARITQKLEWMLNYIKHSKLSLESEIFGHTLLI